MKKILILFAMFIATSVAMTSCGNQTTGSAAQIDTIYADSTNADTLVQNADTAAVDSMVCPD